MISAVVPRTFLFFSQTLQPIIELIYLQHRKKNIYYCEEV